jgi:hypothetical protein
MGMTEADLANAATAGEGGSVMPRRGDDLPTQAFHRSSHCGSNGHCVEVAACTCGVKVRDSKDPDGPVLEFTPGAWAEFTDAIKADEYGLPG